MTLDISKIQAICFDVDGTLRDTDDQYVARVESILRPLHWLLPKKDSAATARWLVMRLEGPVNGFFSLADRLGLDGPLYRLVELSNPWKRDPKHRRYLLVPGVREAVELLNARFPLAVVTARGARSTQAFLEATNLRTHFACVASALSSPRGKPMPDPIYWAAEQMKVKAENCLMVGDTSVDILAGKAAGAQTVAVLSGFGEKKELEELGADLVLPSIADLPALLGLN